ncbi:MAG: sigma-70 family RNA polymerase sigma factor [Pseudomonadaceae bacterium]|nr:sigma-70 family RNA polymerase sigma factor [Pseudomonadaceae bacterium]
MIELESSKGSVELTATTEADLVLRIALRDRDAFQQFYDQTSPRIFALAIKMLRNRSAAEELLQDVYLKVWHSASLYREDKASANTWLVTIARNRAIDWLRAKDNQSERLDSIPELANEPQPLATMNNDSLEACLRQLEPEQRQSIFAAFFDGMTHVEIARHFREPIGTVKSRIRRGLKTLQGCLGL